MLTTIVRGNQIAEKFARKTFPQDFMHAYGSLTDHDGAKNAAEALDHMMKLSCLGTTEIASIKRFCGWTDSGVKKLNEVLSQYELYETLDVRNSANSRRVARAEKQILTNLLFKFCHSHLLFWSVLLGKFFFILIFCILKAL